MGGGLYACKEGEAFVLIKTRSSCIWYFFYFDAFKGQFSFIQPESFPASIFGSLILFRPIFLKQFWVHIIASVLCQEVHIKHFQVLPIERHLCELYFYIFCQIEVFCISNSSGLLRVFTWEMLGLTHPSIDSLIFFNILAIMSVFFFFYLWEFFVTKQMVNVQVKYIVHG